MNKIKLKIKIIDIAAVFILAVILLAVSSCGMLNIGSDSDDYEDLTFASKNNYERNDILIAPDKTTAATQGHDTDIISVPDELTELTESTEIETETETENQMGPNSVTVEPPEQATAKDGTVRLSFIAAGDNMMHLNMIDDAKERANPGENFNFKVMYKDIADIIKSKDIAFVNVETPIAGDEFKYDGYPMFNTPKENGFALVDIGFDIINIANNHMLDKWEKGYMNHITFWENQNVFMIGGFKDIEDFENIKIYEKNGVSIAFLSYTYGTNGMILPAGSQMVIPYIDDATIERQIKTARPLADLLFVAMHWGDENIFTPNQRQRSLAQMMIDNGVDVILGMHPHVLQEIKWVGRPDGKQTLVAYSLGNMISGMIGAKNMIGGLLSFDIVKTTKSGVSDTIIENVELIPIMTQYNMRRKDFQLYKFEDYTLDLAKAHGVINSDNKFSYNYIKDLIVNNIAPEFLSDFYK